MRSALPRNVARTRGRDTGTGDERAQHCLLGILEHRSRAYLTLKMLTNKSTITLLRCLLDAIERFGALKILRNDNEAVFTSRLFQFALRVLHFKHQHTQPGCPWQNGRIEPNKKSVADVTQRLIIAYLRRSRRMD